MNGALAVIYQFVLALWVGGMAIFTFLVTPAIFRSYGRDRAGEIVGKLFPGYFGYKLGVSILALLLFSLMGRPGGAAPLSFLILALLLNLSHRFLLYPEIQKVKKGVASFEADPDSPLRKRFRKLHAVSMALNLAVLVIGIVVMVEEVLNI